MRIVCTLPLLLLAYGEAGTSQPRNAPVELPSRLADKVEQMGCAIPEHSNNSERGNAIRGDFAEGGRTDWAVLCRRGRVTTLIVFLTGPEAGSWEFRKTFDGDGVRLVGLRIMPVDKAYILEHCQPTHGVLPVIDHEGILDGSGGSIVHYYYRGQWLHLPTKQ